MSDSDSDSSSYYTDEEAHEEELRQLKAVLEVDSSSQNDGSDRGSASTSRLSQASSAKDQLNHVQNALAFNKVTEEKLCRLEKVLVARLRECRQRLSEIHITPWHQKSDRQLIFRYVYCGKPYFRDRDNFPPPDNVDTITMEKSGMYDFSDVGTVAGWTVKDKSEFLQQLLKMSQKIKKEQLESQLSELHRQSKKKDSKIMQKDIIQIKNQIDKVKTLPLNEEVVLPLDKEYDWDAVAVALNHRHTPEEYRSLWKLFLHPSINKEGWNKDEHAKLHEIVVKNRLQNWEKIAAELNTGRTGYQCFVYYRTNMGNTTTGQRWTKEEEEYLRRLIEYYREDEYIPWGKVAASMENRTKIQIYNKYARLMELRKGRFLPEEDAVILSGVQKFGINFRKITKYLPGRSIAQLRTRYQILSNKTQTSIVWTVEEDRKLIQLMANQDTAQYVNYAAITKFFSGKDRNQLRARYVTLVKWMKRHHDKDISCAPRRGARRLLHGKGHQDLSDALENLKNRIKNEIDTKKSKKITKDSPEDVIEHAIITTLINEHMQEEDIRRQCPETDIDSDENAAGPSQAVNEVNLRKLLILLKAQLDKPEFESSPLASKYPGLLESEVLPSCFKVKSYSRKTPQKLYVNPNMAPPDIWGKNKLVGAEFVLPPNYSTITGCRRLMALASKYPPDSNNRGPTLHQYVKKNASMKEQVAQFMERFNILFLWPMLLSNEGPREQPNNLPICIAKNMRLRELLATPLGVGVAIPNAHRSHFYPQDQIDLDSTTDDNVALRPLVGNDDFMYIEGDLDDSEHDLDIDSS